MIQEFIELLIHVCVAYKDIFNNEVMIDSGGFLVDVQSAMTSLIVFTQDLMDKYLKAVSDRITQDVSYEVFVILLLSAYLQHVLEEDKISPFGEIRSALDFLYQHVMKVHNIVGNTGIMDNMENIIKNCVKTQVRMLWTCMIVDGWIVRQCAIGDYSNHSASRPKD